jgi:hypothetical protein
MITYFISEGDCRKIVPSICKECNLKLENGVKNCPRCGKLYEKEQKGSSWPMWSITLLVAVLGFLCVLLIYEVATYGPIDGPPYYHTSINFASPEMTRRTIDDEVRWDASMEIHKVSPKDEIHPWTNIHIAIKGSNGTRLVEKMVINPYDVSDFDDGSDGNIDIQAWYIDESEHPNKLEPYDRVIITGLTRDFEESWVEFHIQYNHVGPSMVFLSEFDS